MRDRFLIAALTAAALLAGCSGGGGSGPIVPGNNNNSNPQSAQAQSEGAIADADRLCRDVMQAHGYPMGDFDQRAADISVDHPGVVEHYRAAHTIAQRAERGDAATEDLRQAMVHYRTLFQDLIETHETTTTMERRVA